MMFKQLLFTHKPMLNLLAAVVFISAHNVSIGEPKSNRHQPATESWLSPIANYYVRCSFLDSRCHRPGLHNGVNLITQKSVGIVTPAKGIVIAAEEKNRFFPQHSHLIVIDHGNELVTIVANVNERLVRTGDIVRRGQRIGMTGKTKKNGLFSTHVEIHQNGHPIDPFKLIPYVFFDLHLPQ